VRFYFPTAGSQPAHAGAPFPLVVFSHGNNSEPENYAPLLSALTRAGFVVAAPAYPLSSHAGGGSPVDLPNQPRDASFVIDRALAESRGSTWMHGLIDAGRIGAAGHSLGGMTTYALALNTCCRDTRVKAAEVIDGVAAGFPSAGNFTGLHTPLLIIHGDHDATLPYSMGQGAYASANAPKYFMTIIGGTHSGAAHGGSTASERALTAATIDFFDLYLRNDPAALGRLEHDTQIAGVSTLRAHA
jgi:predicted dienelactone hydrolase